MSLSYSCTVCISLSVTRIAVRPLPLVLLTKSESLRFLIILLAAGCLLRWHCQNWINIASCFWLYSLLLLPWYFSFTWSGSTLHMWGPSTWFQDLPKYLFLETHFPFHSILAVKQLRLWKFRCSLLRYFNERLLRESWVESPTICSFVDSAHTGINRFLQFR